MVGSGSEDAEKRRGGGGGATGVAQFSNTSAVYAQTTQHMEISAQSRSTPADTHDPVANACGMQQPLIHRLQPQSEEEHPHWLQLQHELPQCRCRQLQKTKTSRI